MNSKAFLCPSDDLVEGRFRELQADDGEQTLFLVATRRNGQARAWLNICPHQGRALNWAPDRFLVDPEGNLVCAAHGAVFEPEGGQCIAGPCRGACLRPVALCERDNEIRLDLAA